MINEFRNRRIPCSLFVPDGPGYTNLLPNERICSAKGSQAGANYLEGSEYLQVAYGYDASNLWRNLGILFAFTFLGMALHLLTTEFIQAQQSKGEVLLFPRNQIPDFKSAEDEEEVSDDRIDSETVTSGKSSHNKGNSKGSEGDLVSDRSSGHATSIAMDDRPIFQWEDLEYEVQIKTETRKLLDNVDGWVKPGTLTALMVCS